MDDIQKIKINADDKTDIEGVLRRTTQKRRNNSIVFDSYNLEDCRMGLLPWYDVEINEKNLNDEIQNKTLLFAEIENFDIIFNEDNEIQLLIKLNWNNLSAHWIYACAVGSQSHGIKMLIYQDIQNSIPRGISQRAVTGNTLWQMLNEQEKKFVKKKGISCICYYALETHFGLLNKLFVSPGYDDDFVSFGNSNMFIFSEFFRSKGYNDSSANLHELCKDNNDCLDDYKKDCLLKQHQTPMIVSIRNELTTPRPTTHKIDAISDIMIFYPIRKKRYSSAHTRFQKEFIYHLGNIGNYIYEITIFSRDALKYFLFNSFKHKFSKPMKLFLTAIGSKRMVVTELFGLKMITATQKDQNNNCLDIIYPEQGAFMAIGAGYWLPSFRNIDKTGEEYKYFMRNFTIINKTANRAIENRCMNMWSIELYLRKGIFLPQLEQTIWDIGSKNRKIFTKFPEYEEVVEWMYRTSNTEECEKLLNELETEISNQNDNNNNIEQVNIPLMEQDDTENEDEELKETGMEVD
eukprot:457824_1